MHRHTVETDKVRRPDQHGNIERAAGHQPVRMRGHGAGIYEAGVGRHERHQIAGQAARDGGQLCVNGRL